MRKVEKFGLDIVSLMSLHGNGTRSSLLGRGWTLFHSRVADSRVDGQRW